MMNMLTEGSQVQLVVQNLSRRHTWDPETVQFAGQVVKNLRGLDADQVCVTTDDPLFPVRIINKKRILSVITGGGTQESIQTKAPSVKTGVWLVQGSKGNSYTVTRTGDTWSCECVASGFGRLCKHIKQLQIKQD